MMRFKRGSKVEVLSRNDESYGVWRCAVVVSGNGNTFSVVFDCSSKTNHEDLVSNFSEKLIRPCPPLIDVSISWSSGDLVEVFEDHSWKTAVVLKVLSPNHYLVKLIGYSKELRLHKVDIRVRQLWQDGEWIVIGKGSQRMEELKTDKLTYSISPMLGAETAETSLTAENNTGFLCSCVIKERTRKRDSPCWSSNSKASKRLSYNQTVTNYELKRGRPNYCLESFSTRSLEHNESSIDECSVGSCSVISNSCDEDSNAESLHGKCYSSLGVNVEVRIHSLELQAYRSTLKALYVSGPLNWEQETLLTNLRMSLNISNDEHLLELRNLIGPKASIHVC